MAEVGPDEESAKAYPGQDNSPTSKKELWGWYSYGLAAEIYAVCGVGSFLPVTLEQLARQQGVLWADRSKSCVAPPSTGNSTVGNQPVHAAPGNATSDQCVVDVFGHDVTTSSFAMYTFSLAVLVQVVVLVSFSSLADHGSYRKQLLLTFGLVGATTSVLFLFIVPELYIIASLFVIIGVACLGASNAVLNAFLPLLVKNHPSVRELPDKPAAADIPVEATRENHVADGDGQRPQDDSMIASNTPYLTHDIARASSNIETAPCTTQDAQAMRLSTSISSQGVGIGYMAAVSVQIFGILLLLLLTKILRIESQTLPLRLILFFVGCFWMLFTIPTYLYLRPRPGPPFPKHLATVSPFLRSRESAFMQILARLQVKVNYLIHAWKSLFKTIGLAIHLRQTRLCLIAWFLLSDAVATISGTAILFARTELKISTIGIAVLSITATVSGIIGAFGWPRIQSRLQLKTNRTVVAMILLMELIPLYALAPYFLTFLQTWHVGGLQAWWEIYPLAILHGLVMGGISTYLRSIFSQLVPPGMEAAFFAVFAVTDKGSSAIGPTIVGRIVDRTGSIRPAFGFIALIVLVPSPLMWFIDTRAGREAAMKMARSRGQDPADRSATTTPPIVLTDSTILRMRDQDSSAEGEVDRRTKESDGPYGESHIESITDTLPVSESERQGLLHRSED